MERLLQRTLAFNQRWCTFLESVPLEAIRAQQEAYNRYYPIERELALRGSPATSCTRIPLIDAETLQAWFPALPGPAPTRSFTKTRTKSTAFSAVLL